MTSPWRPPPVSLTSWGGEGWSQLILSQVPGFAWIPVAVVGPWTRLSHLTSHNSHFSVPWVSLMIGLTPLSSVSVFPRVPLVHSLAETLSLTGTIWGLSLRKNIVTATLKLDNTAKSVRKPK